MASDDFTVADWYRCLIIGVKSLLLNDIISENSEKIKEYFNGKIGVLNMLLGEYLKKSNDKTINKMYLKNIIMEQMKMIFP